MRAVASVVDDLFCFFKALRAAWRHGAYMFHNIRWQQKRRAKLGNDPF
jgi:hypothetical protein